MVRVVFVCLGNICRSPLAEGAFRRHVEDRGLSAQFEIDSAGTAGYHVGELPDPRSVEVAQRNGVDLTAQRSRKLVPGDLDHFDVVVAMDRSNLRNIKTLGTGRAALVLMRDEAPGPPGREVPDPYYGGPGGFDAVWAQVDESTRCLLDRLCAP